MVKIASWQLGIRFGLEVAAVFAISQFAADGFVGGMRYLASIGAAALAAHGMWLAAGVFMFAFAVHQLGTMPRPAWLVRQ
jgi:hypothetical protein